MYKRFYLWLRTISPERYLLFGLFLLASIACFWAATLFPRPLEVIALDVGKGDCLLLRGPEGKTVLIDGGSSDRPAPGENIIVPNLYILGVRRLDAIIVTHADADHVNGLPAVIAAMPVKLLLDTGAPTEDSGYQRLLAMASKRGVPYRRMAAGNFLRLGHDARLSMLAPLAGDPHQGNDGSIVTMLNYQSTSMLFTGDLEAEGEARLLARYGSRLRADFLKVAHHGSASSSTQEFLQAVKPRYALLSCPGGTNAQHPSPAALSRLRQAGTSIFRTDVLGQIHLQSNGKHWQIRGFKNDDR